MSSNTIIDNARKKIDAVDDEILKLLNKRAKEVIKIGHEKADKSMSVRVVSREEAIFSRLIKNNTGPLGASSIRAIYTEIIRQSIALEESPKVAYMGPKGTFSYQASLKKFGFSEHFLPVASIGDVFSSVENGTAKYGVVPVENSTEGIVSHTLDLFTDFSVKVCGEIYLGITLNLLSHASSPEEIEKVYSHGQPIAQSRRWIKKNMPDASIIEVSSTSKASEMAAEDIKSAAIASEIAAELYNLPILKRKIEDNPNNLTRFLVIGKDDCPATDSDKTSVVFSVKHRVGALYSMLEEFAKEGVNLTKIESRPSKVKPWEYIFYVDLVGHITHPNVKKSVDNIKKEAVFFRFLGSYHAEAAT